MGKLHKILTPFFAETFSPLNQNAPNNLTIFFEIYMASHATSFSTCKFDGMQQMLPHYYIHMACRSILRC